MHSPNTKPTQVPRIQPICLGKVVAERICLQYAVTGLWLFQFFFWVMLAKHARTFVTGIRQSKQCTAMSYNAVRSIRSRTKHRDSDMSCIVRDWTGQFFSEFLDSQSMRCHLKHKSDQVAPVKLHLFLPKKETNYMILHIVNFCMHLYFYLYIYSYNMYIELYYIIIHIYICICICICYIILCYSI